MVKDMQKINSKSITLVIGTCNRSTYLEKLLDSLKSTGLLHRKDIEVIIIDNGSTDQNTYNLCLNYNIVYLSQTQPGLSSAINTGIKNARGEYIAFTDDDTIVIDPLWLDKLQENLKANPRLGYISGNVLAFKTSTEAQSVWEQKGGLSKGKERKVYTKKYLSSFDPTWRISKVAAGANSMIPKRVLDQIGYFSTFLGGGAPIGHGNTLEIVYRIIRAGYELMYDPESVILHNHPATPWQLRKKMYTYGIGDVCYQLYIFAEYGDWRYLYGAIIRHFLFIFTTLVMALFGQYPMPFSYRVFSLLGSLVGIPLFFVKYIFWKINHE
jgi:glycosyltransferase involved in cell wall biosynthesis